MCGPLRERGTIHRGVGHGWQKTLGKHTSSFLLENLRPAVVFRYVFLLAFNSPIYIEEDLQCRRS